VIAADAGTADMQVISNAIREGAEAFLKRQYRTIGVIAVHGDAHISMMRRRPSAITDDITRARDSIAELTGTQPRWFRPPYGTLSWPALSAAVHLEFATVLWTAWGRDWRQGASPAGVVPRPQLSTNSAEIARSSATPSALVVQVAPRPPVENGCAMHFFWKHVFGIGQSASVVQPARSGILETSHAFSASTRVSAPICAHC